MEGSFEFIKNIKRAKSNFVRINILLILFLPIATSLFIVVFKRELFVFILFLLLLEISFARGLTDDYRTQQSITTTYIFGFGLALVQGIYFIKFVNPVNFIVAFPLYLWSWLSMYGTGLKITPKTIDKKEVFEAVLTNLASIGTMSWIWFSSA